MPSEGVPKCQRCRRDHKKCSPENRQWPGSKCDRCKNYNYECSENLMARRSSQKDIDSSRPLGRLMEGYSHSKFFGCHPSMSRALAVHSQTPSISSLQQIRKSQSPWTGLFEYLRDIDWLNLTCSPRSDPFVGMFRSSTCPVPDLSATPLGQRQMYLEAFSQSQRLIQDTSASHSAISPLETSINILVAHLQRHYPRQAMMLGSEDLATICGNNIRYGSYWDVFRTALQTDEVLLIDPRYSFDNDTPNTTFDSAKQVWLFQELGLKQFCQKLSGLSQMISNLARTEENSEERLFLAAKIPDRIEEVLGPRVSSHVGQNFPTPLLPIDMMTTSPVDLTDGDIYSPTDSACGDGSEDGFSVHDTFQSTAANSCYNRAKLWSS